jgi:hypothetical protein
MGDRTDATGDSGSGAPGSTDGPATGGWSVFGDAPGLAVFLVALVLAAGTWRVGFFITDTYAVANGLVNLADGHLAVDRLRYSLTLGSQPGLHVVDGRLYARNYGQIVAALPVYYALEAATAVARLELVLAAVWSLLVLAAARQVGVVLDRRRPVQLGGSVVALGLFGASVALAPPVDADLTGLVALQAVSVLAAGVVVLAVYRLCTRASGRRAGAVAAGGVLAATPLWFWAAVPKRHTLVAAAAATLLFWFAASRRAGPRVRVPLAARLGGGLPGTVSKALVLRAMAYALTALVAWVHVFEGGLLLAALAAADLATASRMSRRALVAVALGASVGLAPVVATNLAVSGDPLQPPRLTESFEPGGSVELGPGGTVRPADDTGGSGGSAGGETGPTDDGGGSGATGESDDAAGRSAVGALAERVRSSSVFGYAQLLVGEFSDAPTRLYHTYVRSGRIGSDVDYGVNQQEAIELSVAESFPLVGGLVGGLLGWGGLRVRTWRRSSRGTTASPDGGREGGVPGRLRGLPGRVRAADPARQTEGFAILVFVGYATLYFPLLPNESQLTVRYLLPAVSALAYLVVRRRAVERAVADASRALAGSYGAALVAGLALAAVATPALDPAVGEAMQLHGLANLAACGAVVATTAASRAGFIDDTRVTAAALGVAGAATTLLVVRMHLVYFEYGTYAVPVVGELAAALAVAA